MASNCLFSAELSSSRACTVFWNLNNHHLIAILIFTVITITRDINLLEPLSHLLLEVLSLGRVLRPHVLVPLNDHVAKMLATDDEKSG